DRAAMAVCVRATGSIEDEIDAHVDAPLGDLARCVGLHLDVVDPGTLDVVDRLRGALQTVADRVLDALRRRRTDFDDLGDAHDLPSSWIERAFRNAALRR